jgi:hypothetical protein
MKTWRNLLKKENARTCDMYHIFIIASHLIYDVDKASRRFNVETQ